MVVVLGRVQRRPVGVRRPKRERLKGLPMGLKEPTEFLMINNTGCTTPDGKLLLPTGGKDLGKINPMLAIIHFMLAGFFMNFDDGIVF